MPPFTPATGPMSGAWLRLDRHGQVLHASSAAQQLLSDNTDVLTIAGQRLLAPREPERLEHMLRQCRSRGLGAAALTRDERMPLTLLCQRADSARRDGNSDSGPLTGGDSSGQAWLSLRDPEAEQPDLERVRALFALTPCEATVAAGLALGHSSTDIAARLGIQPNTVLTHVKRVLAKTGTRRQAELVSLLLRSVAMAPLAGPPLAVSAAPAWHAASAGSVELGMALT